MSLLKLVSALILCSYYVECLHELCAKKTFDNVSCKKQLGITDGECEVLYYVTNSSECSTLNFDQDVNSSDYLGGVRMEPYLWDYKNQHYYNYTLFNITFSNIRWQSMKFRFQTTTDDNTGLKNHCREIRIKTNETISNTAVLNYDCHWSDQDRLYQNERYYFDYEAQGDNGVMRGRFMYIIPPFKTLSPKNFPKEWMPFVYLNSSHSKQTLDLHIVSPGENIQIDGYVIKIFFSLDKSEVINRVKGCNITSIRRTATQEVVYSHALAAPGWCTFQITPFGPYCSSNVCNSAFSPIINIENEKIVFSVLWIGLIFVIFWIPIILWLVYGSPTKKYRPNVLIIHPPGSKMDAEVINLLGEYFKTELNWRIMWKKDIKLTEHNDPYIWCMDTFDRADVILYIINPCSNDQMVIDYAETNIYRNLHEILLKHVRNNTLRCPIVNVLFKQYKCNQVPDELRHMKTFRLLRDWYSLLYFVMRFNAWDKLKHPLPKLRISKCGRQLCALLDA